MYEIYYAWKPQYPWRVLPGNKFDETNIQRFICDLLDFLNDWASKLFTNLRSKYSNKSEKNNSVSPERCVTFQKISLVVDSDGFCLYHISSVLEQVSMIVNNSEGFRLLRCRVKDCIVSRFALASDWLPNLKRYAFRLWFLLRTWVLKLTCSADRRTIVVMNTSHVQ